MIARHPIVPILLALALAAPLLPAKPPIPPALERSLRAIDAEMIFVGYGVVAPEFGWDDFKGADVKGKILVMLVNDPPSDDPKLFGGKALTYYGRWTYKYESAMRHQAAGAILIHTDASAG